MKNVAVIGGGLSGLYFVYKLLSKVGNKNIYNVHLFEKGNRIGGRIYTQYKEEHITYEAGAGRFNNKHTELFRLIKELGLQDKVQAITNNKRTFIKNGQEENYDSLVQTLLFQKVMKLKKKYDSSYLKTITMRFFLEQTLGLQKTQDIINAFGYNSEFEIHNAYTALEILEHDFNDSIQYFYLQDGLSQITYLLYKKIIELGGVKVYLNTNVNHYEPKSNTLEYIVNQHKLVKKLQCDKVVFCVTHDSLEKFEELIEYDTQLQEFLKGTKSAPLHRIFARFPVKNNNAWFSDINRTTTNLPIRYIIPHNPNTGFIQISYTDNEYAKYWYNMTMQERERQLLKNLKLLFPNKTIPKPIWIDNHYWKEGATYWKPNSKIYKNNKTRNYYVCGEMISEVYCGWMEGSLRTTNSILRYF